MYKLNKISAIISILWVMGLNIVSAQPETEMGEWIKKEDFSDEFDSFDTRKWYKELWNYGVPNYMSASNAGVTDGKLWIKATIAEGDRWFQSCRVQSTHRISYPMYTECAMKASSVSALNTFWMNNGNNTNRDEIDICENNAAPTGNPTHGAETPYINASNWWSAIDGNIINGNTLGQSEHNHNSTKSLSRGNPLKGLKMNEAYHIIGCFWENEKTFHWYLDGEFMGTAIIPNQKNYFTKDLSIIWDLWTNSWDGYATHESLQDDNLNTMYIDWIHTYKLNISNPPLEKFTLGNALADGYEDGWSSNMVINKTAVYTNKRSDNIMLVVDTFRFYSAQQADPLTPFVVKVNGNNDFTVIAIGTTRDKSEYHLGPNEFKFTETPTYITLAPGETIATGYLDANADGSGGGSGAVIPYSLSEPKNQLWYSGAEEGSPSGSVVMGQSPNDNGNVLSLERNYSFNIGFSENTAPSGVAERSITSKAIQVFPNPASNVLNVRGEDIQSIQIFAFNGRCIMSTSEKSNTIDVKHLNQGVYLVKIATAGNDYWERIVIE